MRLLVRVNLKTSAVLPVDVLHGFASRLCSASMCYHSTVGKQMFSINSEFSKTDSFYALE